jgi:acetyl-CoA carboxylase carboxyltransferase component
MAGAAELVAGFPSRPRSPQATAGDDTAPGAGVITGVGGVAAGECVVVANDATIKAVPTIR